MILLQTHARDPRREAYQLDTDTLPAVKAATGSRPEPSQMIVDCRCACGRRVWEVIQKAIQIVTANVSITRVDFFVR